MTHPQTAELRRYRRSVADNSENKMREHNFESVFLHARRETIVPSLADLRSMGPADPMDRGPTRKVHATRLGGPRRTDILRPPGRSGSSLFPKPRSLEAPLRRPPHERGSDQERQKPTDKHGAGHVLTSVQAEERGGHHEGPERRVALATHLDQRIHAIPRVEPQDGP